MDDLRATYRFRVAVDGDCSLWFLDLSGLSMEGGTVGPQPPRLPGVRKYTNITCRRGVADSDTALAWVRPPAGSVIRKNLTITLIGEDGSDARVWQLNNAWPVKCSTTDAGIEVLEIGCEGCLLIS